MTHHKNNETSNEIHEETEPAVTVEISEEAIKSSDTTISTPDENSDATENTDVSPMSEKENTEIIDDLMSQITVLNDEINELRNQVSTERNLYLRTMADFQNFRKRNEEQKMDAISFANSELILSLLPIVDNFERALASSEKTQAFEALSNGVSLIMRQMQDFLVKNGVQPIESVGKTFDPNLHEAVIRVDNEEHEENTILDEIQKGYTLKGRVLRPAQVRVAVSE